MKKTLIAALLTMASINVLAGSVIVHPSNSATLDDKAIKKIFLGKSKSFPGGGSAVPMGLDEGSAGTGAFNKGMLGKSASQLKSYWAKLVFTGRATPPKNVANDAEMIALIAANPNMIGYIEGTGDGSVRVVATY